jgi:DDE superfamily endonuclease/Helix-turn-helix of DDE superfamily endonuclease
MLTIKKLRRKPKHFHNFTGLTPQHFDELLAAVEPLYERAQQERLQNPNRLRARGAGRKFDLELPERLLMSLMYFRLYVTQTLLGYLFDLDSSNVNREINGRMLAILSEVLPVPARDEPLLDLAAAQVDSSSSGGGGGERKRRGKKIGTLEGVLEKHPEFKEVLIDATEQELPKPKDKGRRKELYSGKRKRHTAKMQVLSTRKKLILHLCRHVPGRVSDLVLLRATGVMRRISEEVVVRVDKGYEGLQEEYPGVRVEKPKRAKRGHPLSVLEKILNRAMSTLRIPVEHAIGGLKKFRLLAGIYRGEAERYDESALVIAGLHNYRQLGKLSW